MFRVGDNVFYPYHGAGEVYAIEEKEVLGEKRDYYLIRFALTDTTVMLPIHSSEDTRLRELSRETEIKRCFDLLASEVSESEAFWKARYKKHGEMMRSGYLKDIVLVVCNLYDRNQSKQLSATEKKLYLDGIDMIAGEVSVVMTKQFDTVKQEISRLLALRPTTADTETSATKGTSNA